MKWYRKYRFLHFLEVAGDLLWRTRWGFDVVKITLLVRIAWALTNKQKEEEINPPVIKEK